MTAAPGVAPGLLGRGGGRQSQPARRRGSELLHHVIAREAGRVAVDRRRDIVALFLVEAWYLDAERRQRDARAAAPRPLFLRHRQHPAADPCAAQILGQHEPVAMGEPECGASVEPAAGLAGLRIADEHGEPARIVVSDLAEIVGAETIDDHRYVGGIKLIGYGSFAPKVVPL